MKHLSDVLSPWDAAFADPERVDLFGGQTSTTSASPYSTQELTFPDGLSTSMCNYFGSADEWDQSGDQQLIPIIPIHQSQVSSEQHSPAKLAKR